MKRHSMSRELREKIVDLSMIGKEGHIASGFSIVEILIALFSMDDLKTKNRVMFESFYLSKGHSAIALYAVMRQLDILSESEISSFAGLGSRFGGHPTKTIEPPIPASTGSLGHGLPLALGAAHARKQKMDKRLIFCLAGDGEMNEGSMWESLLLGTKFKLDNLLLIIDDNGSSTRAIDLTSLESKIRSFGWACLCVDGHDVTSLSKALHGTPPKIGRPTCILAKTIKGYGSHATAGSFEWHHKIPTKEDRDVIFEQFYI